MAKNKELKKVNNRYFINMFSIKNISYQFSEFIIFFTILVCDWNNIFVRNIFLTFIDIQNKLHTRFGAMSIRKAYYLLDIYILKFSFSFPSPPSPTTHRGERKGKERTKIFAAR
jgi:hypothetical protein